MYRRFLHYYKVNGENMWSVHSLFAITGLIGYSTYRHLLYNSNNNFSYTQIKSVKNRDEFGMEVGEYQEKIEWPYQIAKNMKARWPWNKLFDDIKR